MSFFFIDETSNRICIIFRFKIKTNPLNLKILQGPVKLIVPEKKPNTVVEPFNITEMHHKVVRIIIDLTIP